MKIIAAGKLRDTVVQFVFCQPVILATLGFTEDSGALRKYQVLSPWLNNGDWSQGISPSKDLELMLGEGVIYKRRSVTAPFDLDFYTFKITPPVMQRFIEAVCPKGHNLVWRSVAPDFPDCSSTQAATASDLSPSKQARPHKRRRVALHRTDVIGSSNEEPNPSLFNHSETLANRASVPRSYSGGE